MLIQNTLQLVTLFYTRIGIFLHFDHLADVKYFDWKYTSLRFIHVLFDLFSQKYFEIGFRLSPSCFNLKYSDTQTKPVSLSEPTFQKLCTQNSVICIV